MKEDKRITLLKKLVLGNKTTAEYKANEELRTIFHEGDLGVVRRSLVDLCENKLLGLSSLGDETQIQWLNRNLDSDDEKGKSEEYNKLKKSIKRLTEDVGSENAHRKIKAIRLFITISGIKFLIEHDTMKRNNWFAKYRIVVSIGLLLLGGVTGWISRNLTTQNREPIESQSISAPNNQINSNTEKLDKNSIKLDTLKHP